MKILNLVLIIVLVWLCSQVHTINQELSIADVISDNHAAELEKLKSTVDELETKLDYQELAISDLELRIDDIETKLNII